MLTKEAFKALLKTLEEPPTHVIFILATTEEEKLLDTILSRCQVFRMRSPSRSVLASVVTDVAKKEGFTLNPEAADLIAIAADGSFRDALGVTQKVIMASGDKIGEVDEVAAIIGAPKSATVREIVGALHEKNAETALTAIRAAVAAQVEMKLFARVLLDHMRAVMLVRNLPAKREEILAAFAEEAATQIAELAAQETPINSHMLLRFLEAVDQVGRSPIPQLPIEIAVVDVCNK